MYPKGMHPKQLWLLHKWRVSGKLVGVVITVILALTSASLHRHTHTQIQSARDISKVEISRVSMQEQFLASSSSVLV